MKNSFNLKEQEIKKGLDELKIKRSKHCSNIVKQALGALLGVAYTALGIYDLTRSDCNFLALTIGPATMCANITAMIRSIKGFSKTTDEILKKEDELSEKEEGEKVK